jgi:polyketide cyclase/dehydrase/lipid transport protein
VVEAHRLLRASREHVFAFVAHPEHLPRYGGPLWLAADLEDRRGGEPLITLRGYFAGLPVEAVIRTASRAPHNVEITQVRGTLRGFSQRFTVESGDDGTVLSSRVEADPGIPMVSDEAAKHFLTQYVERMLDRLRLAADRRAPSRRPARPAVKSELAAIASGDADEPSPDEPVAAAEAGGSVSAPAEGAMHGAASEPDGSLEHAAATPPPHRPPASRGPRPPRSGRGGRQRDPAHRGPQAGAAQNAAPSVQAATPGAPPPGQGQRRRRRRRRRGRGSSGGGAGTGGAAAGGGDAAAGPGNG